MRQSCKFNKASDIVQTVPGLGAEVSGAIDSGVIKDTSATVFHNKIESLSEVGIVARDIFDIIDYEHAYTKFRKHVNDSEKNKSKE